MSRFVTKFGCIAAALTFVCAVAPAASATPGQLDPAFGPLGNGTVLADHGHLDGVVKVLRQADGKIVAVANGQTPNLDPTLVVLRYLTNGALDPSFGTAGVFTANLPSSASLISD